MDSQINKQYKIFMLLFVIYLLAITWIILLKLEFGIPDMGNVRNINLIPFSDPLIINNKPDYSEIYMNAIAFIPYGIFCGVLFSKWPFLKRCLPFILTSLLYEVLQFVFAIGRSDITDFLSNSLGGIMGLVLYIGFCKLVRDQYKANKIVLGFTVVGTVGMSLLLALLIIVNL